MMTDDPRHQRQLSPDEVAAQVAEILKAAEREAQATIEAARRLPPASRDADTPWRASGDGPPPSDDRVRVLVGDLTRTVQSLARRIEAIEAAVAGNGSLAGTGSVVASSQSAPPQPPFTAWERSKTIELTDVRGEARVERMQIVDLALRGFSRAKIADELRPSMSDGDVQRLLDEVLDSR
jgi:hypothetical protein